MGARTFVRANRHLDAALHARPARFNGGAHFRTRKFVQDELAEQAVTASMGARTFVRANRAEHRIAAGQRELQWGRALSYAQIVISLSLSCGSAYASMGARTFVRANWRRIGFTRCVIPGFNGGAHFRTRKCAACRRATASHRASMGARTFVRANSSKTLFLWWCRLLQWGRALSYAQISDGNPSSEPTRLQWGRALSYAQIRRANAPCARCWLLQWGRALSYAQIQWTWTFRSGRYVASMGARTFVRANRSQAWRYTASTLLQWGRALSYAQIVTTRSEARSRSASMGARTFVRANSMPIHGFVIRSKRFNGGAHFRTRKCGTTSIAANTRRFNGGAHFRTRKSLLRRA